MVDEYQDTNRVQYVLVSALAERHRNLFVVGDPDQSIYGWRQADIRNILDFEKDYPDARQIHLELNYRSTARIVEAADRVIRENVARIDRRLRTENDDGEQIVLRELTDQAHEAQFIADEIRRMAEIDGVAYDDVAVMYRTTAQSRAIEEALRFRGIPYQVIGGVRFYERKEVKDVLAVAPPAAQPGRRRRPGARRRQPPHRPRTRSARARRDPHLGGHRASPDARRVPRPRRRRRRREHPGPLRKRARRGAASRLRDRRRCATPPRTLPLTGLFDAIVERTGYGATFDRTEEEDLDRWANVLELRSELERLGDAPASETIAPYLERVALVADVDSLDADERGRVTLITLHSAKGLEFPVVFVAGVEEGLLPISRAVESEHLNPEELEEERRLFYVGMTRAKRLLYLTYASSRATYGRFGYSVPSRFLQSIPDHLLRSLGRRGALRPGSASSLRDKVRGTELRRARTRGVHDDVRTRTDGLPSQVRRRSGHRSQGARRRPGGRRRVRAPRHEAPAGQSRRHGRHRIAGRHRSCATLRVRQLQGYVVTRRRGHDSRAPGSARGAARWPPPARRAAGRNDPRPSRSATCAPRSSATATGFSTPRAFAG